MAWRYGAWVAMVTDHNTNTNNTIWWDVMWTEQGMWLQSCHCVCGKVGNEGCHGKGVQRQHAFVKVTNQSWSDGVAHESLYACATNSWAIRWTELPTGDATVLWRKGLGCHTMGDVTMSCGHGWHIHRLQNIILLATYCTIRYCRTHIYIASVYHAKY